MYIVKGENESVITPEGSAVVILHTIFFFHSINTICCEKGKPRTRSDWLSVKDDLNSKIFARDAAVNSDNRNALNPLK